VGVVVEPLFTVIVKVVAGSVVDNEEYLPGRMLSDEVLQESEERPPVEDIGELIRKPRLIETDRTEDVRGLARSERVYPWLVSDSGPGSVERSVEPEADLVAE
jgi:hypothetical protein